MDTLSFIERIGITDPTAITVISVSLMLFFGFLMTRITKLMRLPNVTAYILSGILMGPFVFNLIPKGTIEGMSFIGDIALSFIAFGTGEYFKMDILKKNGRKVVIITIMEALASSIVVFMATFYILKLDFGFSLILSALASATAPASTLMTIRQTGAKGDFVDTLLGVVALDDVVGLIAFSLAISISSSIAMGVLDFKVLSVPILSNIVVLTVGGAFGFLLKYLLRKRSTDNRLIVTVAILFGFCGICTILGVSPLLGCMSMGMV